MTDTQKSNAKLTTSVNPLSPTVESPISHKRHIFLGNDFYPAFTPIRFRVPPGPPVPRVWEEPPYTIGDQRDVEKSDILLQLFCVTLGFLFVAGFGAIFNFFSFDNELQQEDLPSSDIPSFSTTTLSHFVTSTIENNATLTLALSTQYNDSDQNSSQ